MRPAVADFGDAVVAALGEHVLRPCQVERLRLQLDGAGQVILRRNRDIAGTPHTAVGAGIGLEIRGAVAIGAAQREAPLLVGDRVHPLCFGAVVICLSQLH